MAQAPVRPPLGIVFGKSTDVQARQYANAQTAKYVAGGNILKMIVVPGKIVNVVVK